MRSAGRTAASVRRAFCLHPLAQGLEPLRSGRGRRGELGPARATRLRRAADQGDEVGPQRAADRTEARELRIVDLQGGADVPRPDARRLHAPGEESLLDPGEVLPSRILETLRQGHGPIVEIADDGLQLEAQLPRSAPAPVSVDELVAAGLAGVPAELDGDLLAILREAALQRLEGGSVIVRQPVR